MFRTLRSSGRNSYRVLAVTLVSTALTVALACSRSPHYRTFAQPEDAVKALLDAAKKGSMDELLAIFGPDAKELADSSDPETFKRNREVISAAAAEKWHLIDHGTNGKLLVIGNEEWPFPVPLTKDASGWRFDTTAGKEEVLARRIGRNELAAIRIARTYVTAQRVYAERGHDGQKPGVYARAFRSDEGKQNGLYWPAARGQRRSPLGDLVAYAAAEGSPIDRGGQSPSPFHGYFFKILTAQGASAQGGAKDYVADGLMSGGFALVAWPAQYDATGVMTFIVNQDGTVHEKDLGPDSDATARKMTQYDPDKSWTAVQ